VSGFVHEESVVEPQLDPASLKTLRGHVLELPVHISGKSQSEAAGRQTTLESWTLSIHTPAWQTSFVSHGPTGSEPQGVSSGLVVDTHSPLIHLSAKLQESSSFPQSVPSKTRLGRQDPCPSQLRWLKGGYEYCQQKRKQYQITSDI